MKERKKPWFDRFLDKHPYFPLGISVVSLIVAILLLLLNLGVL